MDFFIIITEDHAPLNVKGFKTIREERSLSIDPFTGSIIFIFIFTAVKNLPASAADARDRGSIPGSGRSPRVGNGNALQDSCLENSMDRGAWQATDHGVTHGVGYN